MFPENILLSVTIVLLSLIQSIFGMGILVFGTPTLLLMGYDFITTLALLVPASMTISLLQIFDVNFKKPVISRNLYYISIPSIAIGLYLAEAFFIESVVRKFIGCMLLLSAAISLKFLNPNIFRSFLIKNIKIYHLIMGMVHGLTNLGGALLAILAGNTTNNKNEMRYAIAHYYFVFTFIQFILVLFFLNNYTILISNFYNVLLAALIYYSIGRLIFKHTGSRAYDVLFGMFMFLYGIMLLTPEKFNDMI